MEQFSEETALRVFRKESSNGEGTNAQVLYQTFVKGAFQNPDNEKKLFLAQTDRERVTLKMGLVHEQAARYFEAIGNPELCDVFFRELENQRCAKQEQIKNEALAKGMVLWHATPLSKEELDGGVLKGVTERPDLVWEKLFTGVCAFPKSNGAYAIKKAKDEQDFACKGDNLVRITDNRLDGKKDDEVLGYIHGHKLTQDDGFMPTVSLDGSVSDEWTTEKDVSIDMTKNVTLKSLRENGVHIFRFDKKDNALIRYLTADKSFDEQIKLFEDMAANPNKTYFDKDGNAQKISVTDYYNQKKSDSINMMLAAKQKEGRLG